MITAAQRAEIAGAKPRRPARTAGEAAAAAFPPLQIEAERVALTVAQGAHGRRRVGSGDAFWQHRLYETRDEPRTIDWRRSARSAEVYVRENEWEAAQTAWVWRDASPSMDYAGRKDVPTKRRRADVLALALVALLIRAGERIGIVGADWPATTGRRAFDLATREIDEGPAAPVSAPPQRDATCAWISDFLDPLDALAESIATAAHTGARGVLLHILDPTEEALPFKGRVKFHGLEGDGDVLLGDVGAAREAYAEAMQARRAALVDIAGRFGWRVLTHRTNRPPERALLALHAAIGAAPAGR
ncbi:MAG: DUF58 domain-containing protein [Pseudomonadota bacterium]